MRLPGGRGGIGFDDLQFASGLGKLLVPAGRPGNAAARCEAGRSSA
jgi:hypothetical protein